MLAEPSQRPQQTHRGRRRQPVDIEAAAERTEAPLERVDLVDQRSLVGRGHPHLHTARTTVTREAVVQPDHEAIPA